MADIEEVVEKPRAGINDDLGGGGFTRQNSTKRKGSRRRRNSGVSQDPVKGSPTDQISVKSQKENGSGRQTVRSQAHSAKQGVLPAREDYQAQFYEDYREVAEEYDKEFLKKHDEDLNTTLVFAGLFSAVTSAFIIEVNSQLQPDPNDETASLLRVLLYKIDNTTFGNDIPTLPQWTGPSQTIVQVQAILFSSLAISLLSSFLAMLGKQWLNLYDWTDMRGSAVERCHNRQRKLGGIVAWYFEHVMESLPLMLQIALLLLGCALSRYLWEINITIASVVIGVTSFGVLFYIFIVIAATVFENCPYQTPSAHIFRHIFHHYLPALRKAPSATFSVLSSTLSELVRNSRCCSLPINWWSLIKRPWYSVSNIAYTLTYYLLLPLLALAVDAYHLSWVILRLLVTIGWTACCWFIATLLPQREQRTIAPDLPCISWILQTSLDRDVHFSTFQRLISMPDLGHLDPILVVDCFGVFIGCINVIDGKVVIIQDLEHLAKVSASGLFRVLHHLMVIDPTSGILADLHRRYNKVFPAEVDFTGLPFSSTMTTIHALVNRFGNPCYDWWNNHRLPGNEHIPFSQRMMEAAQVKDGQTQRGKVPRWMLRSALHFLSLGSLPPASVVADYLTIVAIDMDCDVTNTTSLGESERVERISSLITTRLAVPNQALYKSKAITALVPYAILLARSGHQEMIDAILNVASASNSGKFIWDRVKPYLTTLFDEPSPPPLDRVVTLMSPYVPWDEKLHDGYTVARWVEVALAVPHTEEIGRSVVNALLQIASIDSLRQLIPIELWAWLKEVPLLPPVCRGRRVGTKGAVVRHVRGLGDIEILKSYLLLIWSEWNFLQTSGLDEMQISIRQDFGGIGSKHHREDLIARLDEIFGELDRGWEYIAQHKPGINPYQPHRAKADYRTLKKVLLEVERAANLDAA